MFENAGTLKNATPLMRKHDFAVYEGKDSHDCLVHFSRQVLEHLVIDFLSMLNGFGTPFGDLWANSLGSFFKPRKNQKYRFTFAPGARPSATPPG